MSLILPHRTTTQRHSAIPYLWRASCSCGWSAFAGDAVHARAAADEHLSAEEPFPEDWLPADPDSEAARRK